MDDYVAARAQRALIKFGKGLPSVLRNPAKARALMESGTPGGDYAGALVRANRRGREMGPAAGRSKYWRSEKGRETFRAKARISGSSERAQLQAAAARSRTPENMAREAVSSSRRALSASAASEARNRRKYSAWGSWPKSAPRGNRAADVFNPRARG